MRFALTLILAAGCVNKDAPLTDKVVTTEDVDELLARLEALEAEVAALKASGAPVGIDADADGDGLREWDGLPVGTRRGDVLWEWACPEGADGYTDVSSQPPSWLKPPADPRLAPGFGCYRSWDGAPYGGDGSLSVNSTMVCDRDHSQSFQCIAL
jgi:hypothetical protein